MIQVILVSSWINQCFSNVITIKVHLIRKLNFQNIFKSKRQMVHFLYYYYFLHQENTYLPGDVSFIYFKTKKVTKLINFLEDLPKLSGVDIADLSTCNNTYHLCNNVTGFGEFECLPGRKGNNCSIGIYILSIHIYLNLWKEKKKSVRLVLLVQNITLIKIYHWLSRAVTKLIRGLFSPRSIKWDSYLQRKMADRAYLRAVFSYKYLYFVLTLF